MKNKNILRCFVSFLFGISLLLSLPEEGRSQYSPASSADIQLGLEKLNVLGSALYLAAHPDDENTSVLAYLSKGRLMHAAYLSLTRGDGGQNLLGTEKGALLGVIRTQELLAARRIDGAEQFFTRAIDFGYSKTPEETMRFWDHDAVLADMVRVIRRFRPDIIITRFSRNQGGHGHHLASARLAEEAFYAAADPNRFPDQLKTLKPWQVKRVMWNSWRPATDAIRSDVGTYNPLLGQSYTEMAAAGRSMHKTQGFGASAGRGSRMEAFDRIVGEPMQTDIFDGVDVSWKRVPRSGKVQKLIHSILKNYRPGNPAASVPALVQLYQEMATLADDGWVATKMAEVQTLIRQCSGLWMDAVVWQSSICPGADIDVRTSIVNRSDTPIAVQKLSMSYAERDTSLNTQLQNHKPINIKRTVHIPENAPYSQPYWLKEAATFGMFRVAEADKIGQAENGPALTAHFHLLIDGQAFEYTVPIMHHWTDAVKGEQYQPFYIQPKLSVFVENPSYIFTNGSTHTVNVHVLANADSLNGRVSVTLPKGWRAEPNQVNFDLHNKGDQATCEFVVSSNNGAVSGALKALATVDGRQYTHQIVDIEYPHIKRQTILLPTSARLVKLDIAIVSRTIGYIMGSGDDIPQALRQLGYQVELLSDDDLDLKDLSVYDVIICGVRAFNTRDKLAVQQQRLIEFVDNGGTWIVQHNTRFGNRVKQIGPYPFTVGRERIAEEDAAIEMLIPDHPLLNIPNKITEADFDGWVQERGLYFASHWEGKLYPILSGHDTGEPARLGGLLYAPYGKGVFIYTGYSWFRQLPAGVPGAYRLFVNLISAKGKK